MTALNKEPIAVVIKFKDDFSATLLDGVDKETGVRQEHDEFFHGGREYKVSVFNDMGEYVNLTFPNGSELYGLKKEQFEVVRYFPVKSDSITRTLP